MTKPGVHYVRGRRDRVEPETGATLMGYDAAGNLKWSASGLSASQACEANGTSTTVAARRVDRTYDVRNRVATLTFPDANGNQSWSYTDDGLPASVTTYNDAGATQVVNGYTYNKRRLLTGEQQVSGSNTWAVGYGYDANAHLSTLVYPEDLTSAGNRIVAYAPNALGQPTQAGSYATNVTYYPNGAIAGFTYGNGIVHTLTQNARGLPDRSRDLDGSTPVHDDSYDYDAVGNVLAISDAVAGNRGNRDMGCDALNRLTSATSPMFGTASYAYDVLDNLTHVQVTGGSQARDQTYVYDGHNRLTNVMAGGTSVVGLGYDAQGNLNNKNGVLFGFDYGNRMRTGGPESYRYDVQGRRIRSSSSAGVIDSLYAQSGQLLFQRDGRSGKRRQYIYLGGSLVAESDMPLTGSTATVTYQHTDALGSPVATTNSAKTVLQRSEYEPYGYLLNRPMEDGAGYTGHVTDAATGLLYMQQRYMDPLIGQRFLSVDPVTAYGAGGGFNQYWYADANPYRFSDPDGRRAGDPYAWASGDFSEDGESRGQNPSPTHSKTITRQEGDHDYPVWTKLTEDCDAECVKAWAEASLLFSYPSEGLQPSPADFSGRPVVVYGTLFSDASNPANYTVPGGRVVQSRGPNGAIVNTTLKDHVFCCGTISRTLMITPSRTLYMYTHGIGYNVYPDTGIRSDRLANFNAAAGWQIFRSLDMQLIKYMRGKK